MTMQSNALQKTLRLAAVALVAGLAPWLSATASVPQISAYDDTTCAVVSGAAYCWGYNASGQVGNNSLSPAFTPTPVSGLASGVSAISVGGKHACAVVNGGARCWGFNGTGQLGNNSTETSLVPVAVSGLSSGVTAIAAGDDHSCAIVNGGVRCWGANLNYGQLGDGTSTDSHVPVQVTGLVDGATGATSLVAGGIHSCVVYAGTAYCWGGDGSGQLGNGSPQDLAQRTPVVVTGFTSGVGRIAAGDASSCGVQNGAAYCWGWNGTGQLGNGTYTGSPFPVPVSGLAGGVTAMAMGSQYHACAVLNGAATCWGYNNGGQLGNPDYGGGSQVPIPVSSLPAGVVGIAVGGFHSCAVAPLGIYCWGTNDYGQVGIPAPNRLNLPVLVFATPGSETPTDLDGNGKSDILYRNATTGQVYRIAMNGLVMASGNVAYTEPNTAWKIVGDADFNGDGVTDLLWRNDSSGGVYYMPFAANGLPSGGAMVMTEPRAEWKIVHTPDLDGDGRADILWWNSNTGQVYAMLMNGAVVTHAGFVFTEPNTAWRIVAVGDLAGSGRTNQLVYRNNSTGQVYLMTVTVTANGFTQTGLYIYHEPNLAWKILAAPDLDGDGRSDLLWRNSATGHVYAMLMNGTTAQSQGFVHHEPNLAWKIVAQGDYNGDGKADLLWRNDSNGQVYMMLMNGLAIPSQGPVYVEPDTTWKILGPWEYGLATGIMSP